MSDRPKKRDEALDPGVFRRGDRYRVVVYAGIDPVTGRHRHRRHASRGRQAPCATAGRGRSGQAQGRR
jgi:hypothetical protein